VSDSRQALITAVGSAVKAYQRSTDALDDVAADHIGVNRTDLRCLDWLSDGPMTAGQLTEATGLSSAATTTLLDRLEQKGLVRRLRDATDRRKVLVEMTELGQRLAGDIYEPLAREGGGMLEHYSDAELTLIREVLDTSREITDQHRVRLQEELTRG
jgi:DNA-binding MarR family transcriptional regulator